MRRYPVIALAASLLVVSAFLARPLAQPAGAASPCQFQKSASTVAFCDSFNQPAASNSSRSGPLDPTVWGVSYLSVIENPSQGDDEQFVPASSSQCGGGSLLPPNNLQICNGQLFDTANDGGSQSIVAMYPRQPFDIAGRTGDVTFDVSNDSLDGHAAWPSFVYTDQPVPDPYESLPGINTYARNSFGFTMAGQVSSNCPSGQWSVDTMYVTRGYALSNVPFSRDACVGMSTNPSVMNHVEIQISPSSVAIWASDPGSTGLVEIASAGLTMPLTRGLVWMEDTHYNAGKYSPGQENNTFGWDNFGFDGPILARDRGFDVPVHGQMSGSNENTGWDASSSVSGRTLPVDATSISRAAAALVEFTWVPESGVVPAVSLNGNGPISTAWPFPDSTYYSARTIAVPVPLSEVVQGANTITVESNRALGSVANFDLILAGAGGVPSCLDPSECSSAGSSSGSPPPPPTPVPPSTPEARLSLTPLPSGVFTSGPALSSWSKTRYDLFGRGADGALWHAYSSGGRWSGWEPLGGLIAAGTQPAAVAWGPNRIDIFVEGIDAQLWHIAWVGTGWSGWQPLGGILTGSPAAASWGPNRLDVVVPGLGAGVWHEAWNGSSWGPWEGLGGLTHATPAITTWGQNRLDVFVQGVDGSLYHQWYVGGWSGGWEDLGGGGLTTGPAAASTGAGELDVVVGGPGSLPQHLRWTGSWQPWQGFTSQIQISQGPALTSLLDGRDEEMCLTPSTGLPECSPFKPAG